MLLLLFVMWREKKITYKTDGLFGVRVAVVDKQTVL